MNETKWRSEEFVDDPGTSFARGEAQGPRVRVVAPDGSILYAHRTCIAPNDRAAQDLARRRAVVASVVRACNAHDELVAALRAMMNTHGMHGPCEGNDCRECTRAYDSADALLYKAKADAP